MRSVKGKNVLGSGFRVLSWQLLLTLVVFCLGTLSAQNYPERPNPPRLVNDYAGILSESERDQLEHKLVAYGDSTSTQIAIVALKSLDGAEKGQFAIELLQKWGIGQKGKDNGVLLLIAMDKHELFIATGRGVEEFLPDAICFRIIDNKIKPAFRAGKYYDGLDVATTEMMARLSGNFVNDSKDDKDNKIPFWIILIFIAIVFFILPLIFRNRNGGTTYGRSGWGGGPFLGGGFGGGGFGGGGGGGFGGFGGGGSGGGGAGGGW